MHVGADNKLMTQEHRGGKTKEEEEHWTEKPRCSSYKNKGDQDDAFTSPYVKFAI